MAHPRFIIQRSTDGQYYFTLTSANAEVILTSELYRMRTSAQNGIASVRDNAPFDDRYDRLPSKDKRFYFVLRAKNGEVIGTSQMYATRATRDNGVEAVKRSAPDARIEG